MKKIPKTAEEPGKRGQEYQCFASIDCPFRCLNFNLFGLVFNVSHLSKLLFSFQLNQNCDRQTNLESFVIYFAQKLVKSIYERVFYVQSSVTRAKSEFCQKFRFFTQITTKSPGKMSSEAPVLLWLKVSETKVVSFRNQISSARSPRPPKAQLGEILEDIFYLEPQFVRLLELVLQCDQIWAVLVLQPIPSSWSLVLRRIRFQILPPFQVHLQSSKLYRQEQRLMIQLQMLKDFVEKLALIQHNYFLTFLW